jgi:hypothetical protein
MIDDGAFSTFDNQFYPTPPSLARRAISKFKETRISRLLEPEAGRGDLLDVLMDSQSRHHPPVVECVELDLANQAILRSKGYRVVGTDFLRYRGASVYSHILMNPPFREGVKHVLHAWELLFTGEIVAILNAQALLNPNSAERRQLVTLINDHGSVEFLHEAFMTADTKRTTRVEIALVHLTKASTEYTNFIDGLRRDVEQRHTPAPETFAEVIIPRNFIENLVLSFECAVEASKQACVAQARANHYARRFAKSISTEDEAPTVELFVADSFNKAYDDLKERAWSTVLRSAAVLEKLSSQAQKRVEASFKELCALEFTYENIWGFLDGLISQQGQIQLDMVCDVFDMITKYHSENRAYYQGWRSNDKHRLNAFRIKSTRFVLPAHRRDWYCSFANSLTWDDLQRFRDFDKVFAILDGKHNATTKGIEWVFAQQWDALKSGERVSADYFDVRFYRKAGTFHLFPRRKDLIERMNRLVGEARQWLPHDRNAVPDAFWTQYEKAEKVTAKIRNLDQLAWEATRRFSDEETARAQQRLFDAYQAAAQDLGVHYDASMLLAHEEALQNRFPRLPSRAA